MTEEDKKKESGEITRREFLKDAGLVIGGATIGSTVLLAASCGTAETETVTTTVTESVQKFICPIDSMEFDSLADLQAHFAAEHPSEAIPGLITLTVNGEDYLLKVDPDWTLAFVLRNKLGLTATKEGCSIGQCGTCTVIADGEAVYSCLMLAIEAEGKDIQTLEGISDEITLHPIQQSFVDHQAMQCGYCTPGFIMAAKALLDKNSSPTRDEVREALSGHICICGANKKIMEAVLAV